MSYEIPELGRPLPKLNADTEPWWAALKRHQLLVQTCSDCEMAIHPPRPMCPNCRSMELSWSPSSGKGSVYSWVIINRAFHPYFMEKIPFAVVLVEMEDGTRLVGSIDCENDQLEDGLPVEVTFDDVDDDFSMLLFRVVR
ncbi:MAG: hypothetical protein HOC23_15085 [Halieaceae bacterium]|jgi:uncharacterized protein|nr:hypothetical protein [Halieaceae bacterium]